MRVCTIKARAAALLTILVFHTAVTTPVVRRDLQAALAQEDEETALEQASLAEEEVFGRRSEPKGSESEENARVKRFLKLKTIGGVVGGSIKSAGIAGAKAVGKAGLKAAASVGLKLAKAAVTIGIAKFLLSLVFGKINQVIDFKTRLLGGHGGGAPGLLSVSSLSAGSSSGGGTRGLSGGSGGDSTATDEAHHAENTETPSDQEGDLPVISPERITLDVPNAVITNGFNVVTKAAPLVGEVIQNAAERLARLVEALKPILGSSLGIGVHVKRETPEEFSVAEPEEKDYPEEITYTEQTRRRNSPPDHVNSVYSPIRNSYAALTED